MTNLNRRRFSCTKIHTNDCISVRSTMYAYLNTGTSIVGISVQWIIEYLSKYFIISRNVDVMVK